MHLLYRRDKKGKLEIKYPFSTPGESRDRTTVDTTKAKTKQALVFGSPSRPVPVVYKPLLKQPDLLIRPPNMGNMFQKLLNSFYSKNLEVVLVGLENSGKTTLVNVLAAGHPMETCPTIGLNVKVVKKGGVTMKCWDIGGQEQYRSEWGRYTRGCDVIIYVLDTFAVDKAATARRELHRLLEDRELATTPLLVLANKIDLEPHQQKHDKKSLKLNLEYVTENPWLVLPISAVKQTNIDQVISWLVKHGK